MESDIDKFVGHWVNSEGDRVIIRKETFNSAIVSFLLGPVAIPVARPYYGGLPSTEMQARLRDYGTTIEVNLWTRRKGFDLHLTYEYAYELDEKRREALVPALSWREEDNFLDDYRHLFGCLKHFTKSEYDNSNA
jgi:hypothetical protein